MSDWVLTFARDLALAVWLGGLLVIDLVETPARFRVPAINRNQVVAEGREVFAALNRMEVVVGALLVAASALLAGRAAAVSQKSLAALLSVGVSGSSRSHSSSGRGPACRRPSKISIW